MAILPFKSVLAKKLNTFIPLSSGELKFLGDMQLNPVKVKRGQHFTHEGQTGHKAFILQTGWACSFKLLPNAPEPPKQRRSSTHNACDIRHRREAYTKSGWSQCRNTIQP